jgi:uncharacterized protein (UPF0276 family)
MLRIEEPSSSTQVSVLTKLDRLIFKRYADTQFLLDVTGLKISENLSGNQDTHDHCSTIPLNCICSPNFLDQESN